MDDKHRYKDFPWESPRTLLRIEVDKIAGKILNGIHDYVRCPKSEERQWIKDMYHVALTPDYLTDNTVWRFPKWYEFMWWKNLYRNKIKGGFMFGIGNRKRIYNLEEEVHGLRSEIKRLEGGRVWNLDKIKYLNEEHDQQFELFNMLLKVLNYEVITYDAQVTIEKIKKVKK